MALCAKEQVDLAGSCVTNLPVHLAKSKLSTATDAEKTLDATYTAIQLSLATLPATSTADEKYKHVMDKL